MSAHPPPGQRPPAFQFYARDFLADARVRKMNAAERGVYITALAVCWNEGTVPADLTELALELQLPVDIVATAWPRVAPCFAETDGRLRDLTLERRREEQDEYRRRAATGGRRSAETRAARFGSANPRANREADVKQNVKRALHAVQHTVREANVKQNVNTASASASASATAEDQDQERTAGANAPAAPPSAPPAPAAKGKAPRKTPDDDPRFAAFWDAYPRKVARAAALKAWRALSPGDDLVAALLTALDIQRRSEQWREANGRFIPQPSTWLHGRRWEDQPPEVPPPSVTVTTPTTGNWRTYCRCPEPCELPSRCPGVRAAAAASEVH